MDAMILRGETCYDVSVQFRVDVSVSIDWIRRRGDLISVPTPYDPTHVATATWDTLSNYCKEVRALGMRIQELISESLGLEKEYINNVLGEQGQHMAVNYYPPCPEPELTYGLPGHTDPNALTILLQDLHVSGLQVLKDDKWLAVKPHPNAFVINIGDQLQALSNGIYKSVWHRAIVNTEKPRLSVASFLCPCNDALISPAKPLTEDENGAVYRGFTYAEYYKTFWSRDLLKEHCLELFKNK
ncbi:Protein DOWNY MILDEW RESISTANCE 6 [Stylosanthes scabra]|uniref:Protein DOWNY MILDEW RESISTANCE 6 n=1 Tax=Stylosanthes scabra TaxID=79078 RepID=A0ABU6ZL33_9FABA|nr:Protein DOWNY MILDEW RESISTANCE 6 [Stylosanthes scabra]